MVTSNEDQIAIVAIVVTVVSEAISYSRALHSGLIGYFRWFFRRMNAKSLTLKLLPLKSRLLLDPSCHLSTITFGGGVDDC
jgi:hypothetical protein